jgi:hypothetical protein
MRNTHTTTIGFPKWISFNISPQLELYEEDRLRVEHDQDGNIIRLISDKIVDGKAEQFIYNVKPPKR